MPTRRTHYDRRSAEAARQAILVSRNQFWKPSDVGTPPSTTQRVLADLVQQGELRHVRKGLYWRGIATPLGMSPPSPEALISQLIGGAGSGPAGLSAANELRLSTQVPRRAEYAVVSRPPSDSDTVRFVDRSARRGRAEQALSLADVAALEVLDGWDRVIEVEPNEAMTRLSRLIESGRIDPHRLAGAGATEPGSTRARLRHLLQRAGMPTLAEDVPAADRRTESRALAGLMDA